ncbi:MAG: hypothetical protein ACI395_09605 [Candidatus Cryptobacteroides sp.]
MKTEKDIRSFMLEHRETPSDPDAFMADLVRQMDLLPVPASFEKDGQRIPQEDSCLEKVVRNIKRYNRAKAFTTLIATTLLSIAMTCLVIFLPSSFFEAAGGFLSSLSGGRFSDFFISPSGFLSLKCLAAGILTILSSCLFARRFFA